MLFRGLEAARAWDMLNTPQVSSEFDAEGILELCRRSGMSEEDAQKAARKRGLERLRKDQQA